MNKSNYMSEKWNILFLKATELKIDYVKKQCPICKDKNIKHFLDCQHIEMDLDEINKKVYKKIGKEIKINLKNHLF